MNYLKKSKVFYVVVLLISLLLLWSQIREFAFLQTVFQVTVNTLLVPVVVSLFMYYLLKHFYVFLLGKIKKEGWSLLITFIVFFAVVGLLVRRFIPMLIVQVEALVDNVPQLVTELDEWLVAVDMFGDQGVEDYLSMINRSFEDLFDILFMGLRNSTSFILNFVSSSFLIISIVPIMVFYMLKNTNKPKSFRWVPEKYRELALNYFKDSEQVLSNYISGKSMVCFFVFVGTFISFQIAGLQGAFLFSVIAGIMDIVPYFGPWIGAFPTVLSGLINDDVHIWVILIGVIIVQLGESYLVSPLVMSKEMKMHPLGVIILMLITGQVFGLIGMIIILPVFAVLQVTIKYIIQFVKDNKETIVPFE